MAQIDHITEHVQGWIFPTLYYSKINACDLLKKYIYIYNYNKGNWQNKLK